MPNGQPDTSSFNRAANVVLGASLSFQKVISAGITTPKRKYLNSIHLSASNALSPASVQEFLIRVVVCSSGGKLLGDINILEFNVLNSIGSESALDLGTIYFEQVITLPYNNPIIFDTPILFTEGEPIYVIASTPYAQGDLLLTVPARNVRLSVNGYYEESDNIRYKMRA